MTVYQPNIPTGTVDLDQDYLNLRGNFQQLNIAYGVDHVPFSDTSGVPPTGISGMHNIIHMRSNSTPAALTAVGQLFSANINDTFDTDTVLYFLTGDGKLLQLTSNVQPQRNTNGYTFLPGGILMQWGIATIVASGTTPILFITSNIDFPTTCWNVQVTGIRTNSGGDGVFVLDGSVSATGFTARNGSGSITQIYWTAIGF